MLCEKTERYSHEGDVTYSCEGSTAPETGYDGLPRLVDFDSGTYPEEEYDETVDEYEEFPDAETGCAPDTVIEESAENDAVYENEECGNGGYYSYTEESKIRYALDGVVYEVAEELYFREKEAMENSAYEEPPFHRVFDEQGIEKLDEEYYERKYGKKRRHRRNRAASGELTAAKAFLMQLVFMVPVINIITAASISFRKEASRELKAYSRALAIWSVILTAGVSCYAFFSFISKVKLFS